MDRYQIGVLIAIIGLQFLAAIAVIATIIELQAARIIKAIEQLRKDTK